MPRPVHNMCMRHNRMHITSDHTSSHTRTHTHTRTCTRIHTHQFQGVFTMVRTCGCTIGSLHNKFVVVIPDEMI